MRFICGGFYLVFLSLMSGFALGSPVQYETVRVGSGSYAPSGISAPITTRFSGPAIQTNQIPSYKQIVPVATKPVIGRLGRSLIRGGGVGLAVTAAVEGLGYLIDQATGDIEKIEMVPVGEPSGDSMRGPNRVATGNQSVACSRDFCYQGSSIWYGWDCPATHPVAYLSDEYRYSCYSPGSAQDFEESIVDLDPSDYEVIDDAIDDFSLSQKSRIISQALQDNPISGVSDTADYPTMVISPIPEVQSLFDMWPQLQEALSKALNATLAQLLQLTNPEFSPTPEEQDRIDRGIWAPPPETSVSIDFELPIFCQWAEFICRPFLDTEHPDVPMLDLEEETYDSGLPSGGFCPLPYELELEFFGEYSIYFEPLCDFARGIRSFVIAISYLIAGFIVVGVRR